MALVAEIGNKQDGYLIKSGDWNKLVAAVDKLNEDLAAEVENRTTAIQQCKTQVEADYQAADGEIQDKLRDGLAGLRDTIEELKGQFYRLTLRTLKIAYALGEVADITAHVTGVDGGDLPDDTRPWLHFVANWGTLTAAEGFESRSGVGNRTLAVRTNAAGVAKVRLSDEQVQELETEDEDAVSLVLQTMVPEAGVSYGQLIMESPSPLDAKTKGAFKVMNMAYDQVPEFRKATDKIYRTRFDLMPAIKHPDWGSWKDYGAMVSAFVSADSDPLTPDWSRGASALLVTFREWVSPWVGLGYIQIDDDQVDRLRQTIESRIGKNRAQSLLDMQEAIAGSAADKGLLGAHKVYKNALRALDLLNPPDAPDYLNEMRGQMQNVIALQQAVGAGEQDVVLKALTGVAASADSQVGGVQAQVGDYQDTVKALQAELAGAKKELDSARDLLRSDVDAKIKDFDARVAAAKADFGAEVQVIGEKVGKVQEQVDTVVNQQVLGLVQQVGVLQGQYDKALGDGGDLRILQARVTELHDKYGVFDQQGVEPAKIANRFIDIEQQKVEVQALKAAVLALQNK